MNGTNFTKSDIAPIESSTTGSYIYVGFNSEIQVNATRFEKGSSENGGAIYMT